MNNQIATEMPTKPSQIGQMVRRTFIVCSPAVAGFPGPGNLGGEASTTGRQLDPANDASQLWSVRRVTPSAINTSHNAGGALLLKTRTSMRFVPVRKNGRTSTVDTSFQFRIVPVSTEAPLILSWNRLAAEILSCAARDCCSSVKARRNVVSM